jgi:hypothetical protein
VRRTKRWKFSRTSLVNPQNDVNISMIHYAFSPTPKHTRNTPRQKECFWSLHAENRFSRVFRGFLLVFPGFLISQLLLAVQGFPAVISVIPVFPGLPHFRSVLKMRTTTGKTGITGKTLLWQLFLLVENWKPLVDNFVKTEVFPVQNPQQLPQKPGKPPSIFSPQLLYMY